jgi:hypothetical protein
MEKLILTLSPLIVGAFIGFYASLILERRKNTMGFNLKIFELYDKISQEIIDVLIEMTTLSLKPNSHTLEDIEKWKHSLSKLYFKYYNYLPQKVLNEINCLHSCLTTQGKYIYMTDTNNENRITRSFDSEQAIRFFDDATLVSHDGRITDLINKYGIESLPNSMKINFQARRVIRRIDDFWGHKQLYKWTHRLKKHTIFETKNGSTQQKLYANWGFGADK